MTQNYNAQFPAISTPMVDPKTGNVTKPWIRFMQQIWNRANSNASNIQITPLWKQLAKDGSSPFFSSIIYNPRFVNSNYTGPALIYQGNDWWVYVKDPTGADVSGWPFATSGPCYGRCQAADVNGDGKTEVFAASHGGQSGSTGSIYCISADSALIWQRYNVYQDEGHNDGILNGSVLGGGTAAGGPVANSTSNSLTVGDNPNPNWPANAWTRQEGAGFGASVYITAGTGAGQHIEITGVTGGNTLQLAANWATPPDASSKYQIVPRYTSDVLIQHAGTLNQEGGQWFLYVTSDDNTIVKLNAATGVKIWRFWATENNEPYPLIYDVMGRGTPQVLFNSIDHNTYCLNLDGSFNWKYTAPTGLDSFLDHADLKSDGMQRVLVNQRRSGNPAGGRSVILNGQTGVPIAQSSDNYGDMDSKPLPVPRNDGSGRTDVFFVGDAGYPSLMDADGLTLWQEHVGDTNAFNSFNCSPQLADVNYDGVNEIVACNQQGAVFVFDTQGNILANIVIPSRPGSNQVGIEGVPYIGDINGDGLLEFVIPSVDGYVYCYQWKKFAVAGSG